MLSQLQTIAQESKMGCWSCRQKKLRKQNKQMPTILDMAQNLAFTVMNVTKFAMKTGRVIAGKETIDKRVAICRGCQFLFDQKRCTICGCYIVAKAGLQAEKCPKGKW